MAVKDFIKSTIRVSASIFFAFAALALVGLVIWKVDDAKSKQEAKQYETIKEWPVDLKDNLQMTLVARTKLVDGRMLVVVDIDGYPVYLTDPRLSAKNRAANMTLQFQDKDGFRVYSKVMNMSDFLGVIDTKGTKSGLRYEFDDYVSVATYVRFTQLYVSWTLDTALPASPPPASSSQVEDHCAPNLSKTERLRRLAQHGKLRETGYGEFSAGAKSIHLFHDGSVLSCH